MRSVNPRLVSVVVLGALLFVPACGRTVRGPEGLAKSRAGAASRSAAADASRYPEVISLRDTDPPDLAYRQFELPPGTEVTDYTGRIAAYSHGSPQYPHDVFGLVDLGSGTHRIVMSDCVNEALGYKMFTPRISDTWIAWEEVSQNEANDPKNATWRLYAAPVDAADLAVGKPRLVDGGPTNAKLRPHYTIVGQTIYWTANREAGPHQEPFPRFGSLEALDLRSGHRRTVRRTDTAFSTLCATNGVLCVVESASNEQPDRARAYLIDPSDDRVVLQTDLSNETRVSHFVRASDKWLSWALFPAPGAEWPSLYLAPRTRKDTAEDTATPPRDILMAGIDSIDPAFFGGYVAFESVETSRGSGAIGMPRHVRRIWIADPATRTRAVLVETSDASRDGWWQTCANGQRTATLLLWNDLGPWVEDQSQAKTLVRLYRAAD